MEEKQKLQEADFGLTVDSQSTFDEKGSLARGDEVGGTSLLKNGQVVAGQYEILEKLGDGGMSVVYKARHLSMERTVALKVLLPGRDLDETALRRFQLEAQAAARLEHPGIVRIYEFGLDEGLNCPFLVMDYVQGQTLAEYLSQKSALNEGEAKDIVLQIAQSLAHAHARNVVHRDIKPANIVLQKTEQGRLRSQVLDFGIAKVTDKEAGQMTITRTGEIFGSPDYMSPEQCLGKILDRRADIYSLGCVFYECVMGRAPFHCDSPVETMMLQLSQKAVDFGGRSVSKSVQNIILKALEKDPDKRFASMEEFCLALGGKRAVHASLDTRLAFYLRRLRANPVYALSSLLAFVLVFGTVYYVIEDNRDPVISPDSLKNPVSWHALSEKFDKRGKTDKKIDALKHAIELRADYYAALIELGKTLAYTKRDFPGGLIYLERAAVLQPDNPYVNQMIAECLRHIAPAQIKAGKLSEAAVNYKRLADLEPENAWPLASLGEIALRSGDFKISAGFFKQALALDPQFAIMRWHKAALRKVGMGEEADRIDAAFRGVK